MSITLQGQEGEKKARLFLKEIGFSGLMQLDWVAERNGKYYQFEVKCKSAFVPPPFMGHGLELYQCERRIKLYKATGIRCGFIVFDVGLVYYQWLDVLLLGKTHTTKNNIIIFPIENFNKHSYLD